jgi:type I restriction enzyme R subunit
MNASANFGFLAAHDANLANLGALAERYFRDDPPTSLVKLRQFAELLASRLRVKQQIFSAKGLS